MNEKSTFSLKGCVALVTGSNMGIGACIAERLAALGCDLVLHGRLTEQEKATGAEEAVASQRKRLESAFGVRTAFADIDLSEGEGATEKLFSIAESELRSPSILINNAGFQHVAPIEDFSAEIWERMLALHTSAPFYAIKRALPAMRRAGFGRIVNIVSVQGLVGSVHKAGYVTSKHGLTGLTKVTALETAEENITCNAICPGFADTELARKQVRERAKKGGISEEQAKHGLLFEKQPSLAFVPIEDIAEMVCYLCSEHARHITGASMSIDGGWFAR